MIYTMLYASISDSPQDKRKFEQLYLEYRQTMYCAAYQILQDPYEAEDAVHNSFVRIIEHLNKINLLDGRRTKGFVVIVAENAAIDLYRKRKRMNTVSLDELPLHSANSKPMDHDGKTGLQRALEVMPVQYKDILLLKYSYGYGNAEISQILHITEDNVRQRIARAKKKLSELLKQEGGYDELFRR